MKCRVRAGVWLGVVVLGATSVVWAFPGFGDTFDTRYPASTSDDNVEAIPPQGSPFAEMDCLLCHGFYNFDGAGDVNVNLLGNFNEFGFAVKTQFDIHVGNPAIPDPLDQAIADVENTDSDGDGHTNLQEILAGKQPGWRPGSVNTIHRLGGPDLLNQPPPVGLIDLDPVPGGVVYCTGKIDSAGCLPSIGATGSASLASPSPFTISATNVQNNVAGVFFYGTAGRANVPLAGGAIMCAQGPLQRMIPQSSMGNAGGPDCSGTLSIDANAAIVQGGGMAVGDTVNGQFFMRDPGGATNFTVSDAIEFDVCP